MIQSCNGLHVAYCFNMYDVINASNANLDFISLKKKIEVYFITF